MSIALDRIFSPFWLTSQILPAGVEVVEQSSSSQPPSLDRPHGLVTKAAFSPFRALARPHVYKTTKAEGYAKVIINITRGVAELYETKDVEKGTTQTDHLGATVAPLDQTGGENDARRVTAVNEGSSTDKTTPTFFPVFRIYANDLAVYQTRVIGLEPPRMSAAMAKGALSVRGLSSKSQQLDPAEVKAVDTSPSTAACSPLASSEDQLHLKAVYDLVWDEEVTLGLHSPASVITMQLMDRDFCSDIALSEDLLTSVSIPLAVQRPSKPLDLVLQVFCTLPQSYSLESLATAAERLALNSRLGEMDTSQVKALLLQRPASALKCRIHVSLTLLPADSVSSLQLAEIAALGLPRGPWTPEYILGNLETQDPMVMTTGSGLSALETDCESITFLWLCRALSCLLSILFSDEACSTTGDFPMTTHDSSGKESLSAYAQVCEDLLQISDCLIIGPTQRLKVCYCKAMSSSLMRLIVFGSTIGLCCLMTFQPRTASLLLSFFLLLLYIGLTHFHLPRVPLSSSSVRSDIYATLASLQGADVIIKPLERALLGISAARRLRAVEAWTSKIRREVCCHPKTLACSDDVVTHVWRAMKEPMLLLLLSLTLAVRQVLVVIQIGCLVSLSLYLLRKNRFAIVWWSFFRGVRRWRQLKQIRRHAHHVSKDGSGGIAIRSKQQS